MANIPFLDGLRVLKYMESSGSGTDQDPYRIRHSNDGLTDAQLRAAPVPVSTGLTPLTDAQLRASSIPVSTGLTPLTDAQLRSAAVPVSLPTGTVIPTLTTTTTSGTISSGAIEVSVANIGGAVGLLLGAQIDAGVSIELRAPTGRTLSAIAYDATGTKFLISEMR